MNGIMNKRDSASTPEFLARKISDSLSGESFLAFCEAETTVIEVQGSQLKTKINLLEICYCNESGAPLLGLVKSIY